MRTIRFRAWDTRRKEMTATGSYRDTGFILGLDGSIFAIYDGEIDSTVTQWTILMQSTGLHDSAGVEIFEGDIVDDTAQSGYLSRGVVNWGRWEDEEYGTLIDCWLAGHYPLTSVVEIRNGKVIGNRYQSPELLGKEKAPATLPGL